MPASSVTSLAGLPENSRESLWSNAISSCAILRRSDSYVSRISRVAVPFRTEASFQPRLYAINVVSGNSLRERSSRGARGTNYLAC